MGERSRHGVTFPGCCKGKLRPAHTHGAAEPNERQLSRSKRGGGTGGDCERSGIAEFIRGYS